MWRQKARASAEVTAARAGPAAASGEGEERASARRGACLTLAGARLVEEDQGGRVQARRLRPPRCPCRLVALPRDRRLFSAGTRAERADATSSPETHPNPLGRLPAGTVLGQRGVRMRPHLSAEGRGSLRRDLRRAARTPTRHQVIWRCRQPAPPLPRARTEAEGALDLGRRQAGPPYPQHPPTEVDRGGARHAQDGATPPNISQPAQVRASTNRLEGRAKARRQTERGTFAGTMVDASDSP